MIFSENRYTLFRIMRWAIFRLICGQSYSRDRQCQRAVARI
jgi:hypothetical protein